jgi:hypothetical protein
MEKIEIKIGTNQFSSLSLPIKGDMLNITNGLIKIPFMLNVDTREIGVYDNISWDVKQLLGDINFVAYPSGSTAVSIVNTSLAPNYSYTWEVGGVLTASTTNPPILYSTIPTAYTVCLTATNVVGFIKTCKTIHIGNYLTATNLGTTSTFSSRYFNFYLDVFDDNNNFLKRNRILNYDRGVSGIGSNIKLNWTYPGFRYDLYLLGDSSSNVYKTTIFDTSYTLDSNYTSLPTSSLPDTVDYYTCQLTGVTTQGLTESTLFEFISYGTGNTINVGAVSAGKQVISKSGLTDNSILYVIKQSGNTNLYFYEYSGVTGVTTYYQYTPNGLGRNDLSFTGITKRDIMVGIIEKPKINNYSFINRGNNNVFETMFKFCDVNTVDDITGYNNNSFNVKKEQEK